MQKAEKCELCGVELEAGNYGTNMEGRSRHHRIAERFNKFQEQGEFLPEDREHEILVLCFFCHEEMLHNPILLPSVEEQLRKVFAGKGYVQRLRAFAEVIGLGAVAYNVVDRIGGP